MTTDITVNNVMKFKDSLFVQTVLFYKLSFGALSLYATIWTLIIWILFSPENSSLFIKIILFTSLPWVLFAFDFVIHFRTIYATTVLKTDFLLMNTVKNEVSLDVEIPRNAIKDILYLKNYIVIVSNKNIKFIINCKSLAQDKKSLLLDYLKRTLAPAPPPLPKRNR